MDWSILPKLWPLPAVGILFGLVLLFGSGLLKQYLDASILKYIRPAGTILVVLCIGTLILLSGMWTIQSVKSLAQSAKPPENPVIETITEDLQPTATPTATPELLPTIAPTATPEPTMPPNALDPDCMPDAVFAGDITVPDGTEFKPGESFTKTWLIRSIGCAAWPENSQLAFESGDQMSAAPSAAVDVTAPDSTTEVSVQFTAPAQPGEYTSFWQLETQQGVRYGSRIYVLIRVVEATQP